MEVEIIRSKRKTMEIQICPDGHIRVRAPYRMRKAEIDAFLQEKSQWIEKHTAIVRERQKKREQEPLKKLDMEKINELAEKALEVLPDKVWYFANKIGVDFSHVTIRNQKTRWGSCSSKGNLNFNCLLMLMPEEILDYVVVHELCHRKEMNNSKRFWAEVEKVMPDYKERRRWLKEYGEDIMRRMTGE